MNRLRRPLPGCPRCGSRDTIRIVLGQPRPDLYFASRSPRGVLRRVGLGIDNPDRVCRRCGQQFGTKFRR